MLVKFSRRYCPSQLHEWSFGGLRVEEWEAWLPLVGFIEWGIHVYVMAELTVQ